MTFDEWLASSPYRFQAGGVNEPILREVWKAACERCAKVCDLTAQEQMTLRQESDDDEDADAYCHAAGMLEGCAKAIREGK